jgi:signal peptidase II
VVTPSTRQRELWIALVIVVLDQAVKALVRGHVALNESVTVVPGFFDLTRVHNTGTAFGFMNGVEFPFKTIILACVAVAALAGVALYTISLPYEQRLARTGLALIIGGAAGNLIDRVSWGYVVDFVDVYWSGWHFWAFNVADAAITVGVALMILEQLGAGTRHVSRAI